MSLLTLSNLPQKKKNNEINNKLFWVSRLRDIKIVVAYCCEYKCLHYLKPKPQFLAFYSHESEHSSLQNNPWQKLGRSLKHSWVSPIEDTCEWSMASRLEDTMSEADLNG